MSQYIEINLQELHRVPRAGFPPGALERLRDDMEGRMWAIIHSARLGNQIQSVIPLDRMSFKRKEVYGLGDFYEAKMPLLVDASCVTVEDYGRFPHHHLSPGDVNAG